MTFSYRSDTMVGTVFLLPATDFYCPEFCGVGVADTENAPSPSARA